MKTIELETFLHADTSDVWDHILQPRLLNFVAKGVLTFHPVDPVVFPERWLVGEYRVRKYLWGWLPLGWQVIGIEFLPDQGRTRRLRDNGRGWLIPTWDHTIEAGVFTFLVVAFARRFYRHRQNRCQKLVAADFEYGAVR